MDEEDEPPLFHLFPFHMPSLPIVSLFMGHHSAFGTSYLRIKKE
jgi:hypothetical protein